MSSVDEGTQAGLSIFFSPLVFLFVRILILNAFQQRILTITCRSGLSRCTAALLEKLSNLLLGHGLQHQLAEGNLRPLNRLAALNVSTIYLKYRLATALKLKQVFQVKVPQKLGLGSRQFL